MEYGRNVKNANENTKFCEKNLEIGFIYNAKRKTQVRNSAKASETLTR
jgi:hypothetical protein